MEPRIGSDLEAARVIDGRRPQTQTEDDRQSKDADSKDLDSNESLSLPLDDFWRQAEAEIDKPTDGGLSADDFEKEMAQILAMNQ